MRLKYIREDCFTRWVDFEKERIKHLTEVTGL